MRCPHETSVSPRGATGRVLILLMLAASIAGLRAAGAPTATTFPSAQAAALALGAAYESGNPAAVAAILGDTNQFLVRCGDPVIDRHEREWFLAQFRKGHKVEPDGSIRAVLEIGSRDEPYPIPIVKAGKRWRFDPKEGHEDLLSRRMSKTELTALEVLQETAKDQADYFKKDRDGDGIQEYARLFRSAPDRRDGLCWEEAPGKLEGPLAKFARMMIKEGYDLKASANSMTYCGYAFRILLSQGPDAPGGARNYIVKGKMTGGFAIVAWPLRYGASGILTMLVGPAGVVYQKDFGAATAAAVRSMTRFNPDQTWDEGSE